MLFESFLCVQSFCVPSNLSFGRSHFQYFNNLKTMGPKRLFQHLYSFFCSKTLSVMFFKYFYSLLFPCYLRGTGESLWYSANLSATAGLSEAEVRRGCGSTGTGFGLLLRLKKKFYHNNISYSLHLMRLPKELQDYVILHELSHTREKNHQPPFWNLLDSVTGRKAKLLDKQVKQYTTRIY